MPKFNIEISDNAYYPDIEANTPEEAILAALEWWIERDPDIRCEEANIHCEEVQEDAEVL